MRHEAKNRHHRSTPLEVLELFRTWDPEVSLKAACAFLYVAENEGLSISELAYLLRTSASTATRVVAQLASPSPEEPEPLLEVRPWPGDGRVRTVHLGARGRELLEQVNSSIREAQPIQAHPTTTYLAA